MRTKIMVTLGAMLCVMLSVPAMATEIALDVPNYSFESPVTSSYYFGVGQWGRVGNAGTFSNSAGYGTPIANCNGNQMVFLGNTTGYMMWTDMPVILTK
ncbi:MAG: hypothetical protein JXR87_03940, partial [Candidatus Marinimicrobia bacterium]|nr:hypothetical protein [Candidatus Neomarinimicrobiota bacterium]